MMYMYIRITLYTLNKVLYIYIYIIFVSYAAMKLEKKNRQICSQKVD